MLAVRQYIAKEKYELEMKCLERDNLTTQLTMLRAKQDVDKKDYSYALSILQNNIDMVNVGIARHKIELINLTSSLKTL
jgi:hypothetical protein